MTSLSYQNKAYVPYGEILLWICQADKIFMETIICSLYFKEYAHTFCFFGKFLASIGQIFGVRVLITNIQVGGSKSLPKVFPVLIQWVKFWFTDCIVELIVNYA